MTFKPSKYQQTFYDWMLHGEGSAVIEAVAGSGKSTTILNGLSMIDTCLRVAFLAFNKSIADELKQKAPPHVDVKTLNGLGHGALMGALGRGISLDANKTKAIIKEHLPEHAQAYIGPIQKLVGLAKSHGLAPKGIHGITPLFHTSYERWEELTLRFDIDIDEFSVDMVYEFCDQVLTLSIQNRKTIDFDDQLYLTVLLGASIRKYDWLFVDEAQDVSHIQRAMLKMALKPGGRLVAVGDTNQAIYGFRGADSSALRNIEKAFNAITMPLSITYRCPKKVVELAQTFVPHLEVAETAIDGEVKNLGGKFSSEIFNPSDLILCRNTAPIISMAYRLINDKVPCRVLGRDIGAGLKALVKRLKAKDMKHLYVKLDAWANREIDRAMIKDNEQKVQSIEDKRDSLLTIMGECESIGEVNVSIDELFSGSRGVKLSTIHKAKGLEADSVYILNCALMPSKYAKQEWQMEQERNLIYVAYTRAKQSLIFIDI